MTAKVIKVSSKKIPNPFYIREGITPEQTKQLIDLTRSEKESLTRDSERFSSVSSYKKWAAKERTIYIITDNAGNDGDLYGIFWIGKKLLPKRLNYKEVLDPKFYRYTYAIRLYDKARGKGLSQTVINECIGRFLLGKTLPVGVWIETHKDNAALIHISKKQGARVASGPDKNDRIILVKEYKNTP